MRHSPSRRQRAVALLPVTGLIVGCAGPGQPTTPLPDLLLTDAEAPVEALAPTDSTEWMHLRDTTAHDLEGVSVSPEECASYNADLALARASDEELAARVTAVGETEGVRFILYLTPHTEAIARQTDAATACADVTITRDMSDGEVSADVSFEEISEDAPDGTSDFSALRRHVVADEGEIAPAETAVVHSGVAREIGVEVLAFRGPAVDGDSFDATMAAVFAAQVEKINAAE